jgi:pimeloyl-ACP methyl ester carboxylesterase
MAMKVSAAGFLLRAVGAVVCGLAVSLASFQASAATRARKVDVGQNVSLNVLDAGASSAKATLVLIPGWRLTASIWSHQIETFEKERRVLAIDPRSQGDSTKTGEGDTPEQRARDYQALLKQLHAGPIILLGWSQGVQDVAAYIEQFGTGDVKAIVLVDSTISKGAANLPNILPYAVQQLRLLPLMSRSPREYTEGMMQAIISRPLAEAERNHLVDEALKTPTATGEAMLIADLFGVDRSPAIAKFTVPTLVIASGRSSELAQQRELAKQLPNAQLEVMQNAAHAVFVDDPEQFERLLKRFLEQAAV